MSSNTGLSSLFDVTDVRDTICVGAHACASSLFGLMLLLLLAAVPPPLLVALQVVVALQVYLLMPFQHNQLAISQLSSAVDDFDVPFPQLAFDAACRRLAMLTRLGCVNSSVSRTSR